MAVEATRPSHSPSLGHLALHPQGMRWLGALCLLVLLLCGEAIVQLDRSRRDQAVLALATAAASNLRGRLETELNSTLFLTSGLTAYVTGVETHLDETHIMALLSALYRHGRNIRNIAVAPANRVAWIYPPKGNEPVLGLYYPTNADQWPAIQRAMLTRTTQVAGPLKLVQGGMGLIARTPVFNSDNSYWGLLSMAIDWDALQRRAGIQERVGDFRIAIRGRDGLGRQGAVFFGDSRVFAQKPVTMELTLAGGVWSIGVVPVAGWEAASQPPEWARLLYVALSVMMASLFYGMLRDTAARHVSNQRLAGFNLELEQRVAARTRDLQTTNSTLEQTLNTLRETQQELVRNEKLAALGALVAGVAHELNTPLGNSVLAATTLEHRARTLRDSEGRLTRTQWRQSIEEVLEASVLVHQSVSRAARLVATFKQVAADRSSEQRREFELHTLVANVLLMLQPTLRHAGVQVEQEVPILKMDSYPGLLDQVLMNLILNAITHAFPGGRNGQISLNASVEGETVRLVVRDNGAGMAPEVRTRVFDPFFTTRLGQGGTGLGLHIVYNIVSGPLGGRIDVDSQAGMGTAFTLRLPLSAPPSEPDQTRLTMPDNK